MSRVSIQKYKQATVNGAQNSDPYHMVLMVFNNVVGKIAAAKGCIERKEIESKGNLISACITLISALRESLNFELGGDIAQNLDNLYEFCVVTLVEANRNNDIEKLNSVSQIISSLTEAWEAIPPAQRQPAPAAAPAATAEPAAAQGA